MMAQAEQVSVLLFCRDWLRAGRRCIRQHPGVDAIAPPGGIADEVILFCCV